MSGINFFGSQELQNSVINSLQEVERKEYIYYTIPISDNISIPLIKHNLSIPEIGTVSITRLSTAAVADYFAFPGYTSLNSLPQVEKIIHSANSDIILLSNMVKGSIIHQIFEESKQGVILPAVSTFGIDCNRTFSEYINSLSSSMRRTSKRKLQLAESRGTFEFKKCTEEDLNRILKMQASRAETRNYDKLNNQNNLVTVLQSLVHTQDIKVAKYNINNKAVSGLLIFSEPNCWSIYTQGFDKTYSELSPSFSTITWLVKEACSTKVGYIDLLRGNEPYKTSIAKCEIPLVKFLAVKNPKIDASSVEKYIRGWNE